MVIGGGVSAAGDMLLKVVENYFHKFAYSQVRTSTKIKLAQLGNDAGVIGAASLVKHYKR
ncbi:ROK family protein [Neobacillus drentensis]|uniref:ROK family protein n=1 Tax=Neobacillus TaxID=2675232 RepID=UPI0029E7F13B|nr:ROK family protein [Neobacillus rhizosphaerae]